jgi:cytochrome c-type biogenesis protein CcmH
MTLRRISLFLLTFTLITFALQTQAALAQEPSDDEVNAIAKQLYCPVCENIPLDVCPTVACEQWRATIREKLSEGWNESQIKDYFVAQYGDRVLATPPATGLNVLVYILPPVAFLIGAAVLFRAVRSWRSASQKMESDATLPLIMDDQPYIRQFEELLKEREAE